MRERREGSEQQLEIAPTLKKERSQGQAGPRRDLGGASERARARTHDEPANPTDRPNRDRRTISRSFAGAPPSGDEQRGGLDRRRPFPLLRNSSSPRHSCSESTDDTLLASLFAIYIRNFVGKQARRYRVVENKGSNMHKGQLLVALHLILFREPFYRHL